MMGSCMLRDASGNITEYLIGLEESESDPLMYVTNCTGRQCDYGLENDNQVFEMIYRNLSYRNFQHKVCFQAVALVSLWGPLIYGGCFAATLSSAIASLVGAPRVLQVL